MEKPANNCYITRYQNGYFRLFFPNFDKTKSRKNAEFNDVIFPGEDPTIEQIQHAMLRSRRLVRDLALENNFTHFVTLTNGTDRSDKDFFKYIQHRLAEYHRKNKNFQYLLVTDRSGDNQNKLHFHGFIKGVPESELIPARYPKSKRLIKYHKKWQVYNWDPFTDVGFTNITEIESLEACSQYAAKYCTKKNWDLLLDIPRKVIHSLNLKMPERDFVYMDPNDWVNQYIKDTMYPGSDKIVPDPKMRTYENHWGISVYVKNKNTSKN